MMRGEFRILKCKVAGVEAVEATTSHTFPRHTHEHFGIGVIHRGAQKSHSGRGMVEAGAGNTITVNPGEVHDGAPIGDAGRAWRMLYFDPLLIADAMHGMSEGRTTACEFCYPVIKAAGVANRVLKLFAAVTSGHKGENEWEESLLMLLAAVMDDQNQPNRERPVPKAIFNARSLIDDHPAAATTLHDLARESGLSRFQVLRGFVRVTGLTPHAYLVQRRIDLARRLIARGACLADAAAASGFADQSHMTRTFVRRYGISPGAYADAVM